MDLWPRDAVMPAAALCGALGHVFLLPLPYLESLDQGKLSSQPLRILGKPALRRLNAPPIITPIHKIKQVCCGTLQ